MFCSLIKITATCKIFLMVICKARSIIQWLSINLTRITKSVKMFRASTLLVLSVVIAITLAGPTGQKGPVKVFVIISIFCLSLKWEIWRYYSSNYRTALCVLLTSKLTLLFAETSPLPIWSSVSRISLSLARTVNIVSAILWKFSPKMLTVSWFAQQ